MTIKPEKPLSQRMTARATSERDKLKFKVEGYKSRIAELTSALDLALCYLSQYEPPDSRAVSDAFVAMAAIAAGGDTVNDAAREIVKTRLEAIKNNPPELSVYELIAQTLEHKAITLEYELSARPWEAEMTAIKCSIWREAAQIARNRGLIITGA